MVLRGAGWRPVLAFRSGFSGSASSPGVAAGVAVRRVVRVVLGAQGGDGGLEEVEGRSQGRLDSFVAERGVLHEEVHGLPPRERLLAGEDVGELAGEFQDGQASLHVVRVRVLELPEAFPDPVLFLAVLRRFLVVLLGRDSSVEEVLVHRVESGLEPVVLDILDEKYHVSRQGVLGDPYKYLEVTVGGFELWCERFVPDYAAHAKKIAIAIIEADHRDPDKGWYPAEAKDLAERMNLPEPVAIQVFQNLERLGRIKIGKTLGRYEAISVSSAFKREMLAAKS